MKRRPSRISDSMAGMGMIAVDPPSHAEEEEDEEEEEEMFSRGAAWPSGSSEKKRRLSSEQVTALERSFEVENKLEPERKAKLALELGLQPRQVAIWFQNRRARWKTKQLERDYGVLKANYDALRASHDVLRRDKEALLLEIGELKAKLGVDEEAEAVRKEAEAEAEAGEIELPEMESDSSDVLTDENLPPISTAFQYYEDQDLFVGFNCISSSSPSLPPWQASRVELQCFPNQHPFKVEEDEGVYSEGFFSDEHQLSAAVPWYSSDPWREYFVIQDNDRSTV